MKTIAPLTLSLIFLFDIADAQNVGIGTTSPSSSAALEINSTTGALLLPRMTTAQRNSLSQVEGMIIYNTDFSKFQGYGLVSELNDQSQTSYTNTCTGGGCGSKWQSFTPGYSGTLTSVKLFIQISGPCCPTTITVNIHSGSGIGGTVLQTSNADILSAGASYITVPFHVPLTGGSVYTIEFISPSTGCNSTNDNVLWYLNTSDYYAAGHCFCCTEQINQDFYFVTSMGSFGWLNLY